MSFRGRSFLLGEVPSTSGRDGTGTPPEGAGADIEAEDRQFSRKDSVSVVARFRPPNASEQRSSTICVDFDEEGKGVSVNVKGLKEYRGDRDEYRFTFDRVFTPAANQADVYDATTRQLVADVLDGYYATVFAYGQTGSGKTYTMEGAMGARDEDTEGIMPRAVQQIFDAVESAPEDVDFTIKVSYVEIYMERIRCLLDRQQQKNNLEIRVDLNRGVYVDGATELEVQSDAELLRVAAEGSAMRHVAATKMNADSSRSHACMMITVVQKSRRDLTAKTGKLFLVDLAGSEMVGKTGATGERLEEAKLINKSLSALGLVIKALTDKAATFVPYRDSKLTRILQDSLGGTSRACLIVACSPASANVAETISTLRFGTRAKFIRNRPKVHVGYGGTRMDELLQKREAQIDQLREELAALHTERQRLARQAELYRIKFGPLEGPGDMVDLRGVVEGYREQAVRMRHEVGAIAKEAQMTRQAMAEVDRYLREDYALFSKLGNILTRLFKRPGGEDADGGGDDETKEAREQERRELEHTVYESVSMGKWRSRQMMLRAEPLGKAAKAVHEAAVEAEERITGIAGAPLREANGGARRGAAAQVPSAKKTARELGQPGVGKPARGPSLGRI